MQRIAANDHDVIDGIDTERAQTCLFGRLGIGNQRAEFTFAGRFSIIGGFGRQQSINSPFDERGLEVATARPLAVADALARSPFDALKTE